MNYRHILAFVVMLFYVNTSFSQSKNSKLVLTDEVFCVNSDYKFELEGKIFEENKKVYMCPKNLPTNLKVKYSFTLDSVPGIFEWKTNGTIQSDTTSSILVDNSYFTGNKIEFECRFVDTAGTTVNLEFEISNDIEITFKENKKNFQFDDNNHSHYVTDYPSTGPVGTPWNFLPENGSDTLSVRSSKKKGFYAVNDISANNSFLAIDPTFLSQREEDISLSFNHNGHNLIDVNGCHESIPELKIYTESTKTFGIEFFIVCESDDDIQVEPPGTPVADSMAVCIDGGMDGSIDLMLKSGFIKGDDKIWLDQGRWKVRAGVDTICETAIHPNGPAVCPSNFDFTAALETANSVIQKIGVTAFTVSLDTLYANYDVIKDDGKLLDEEKTVFYNKRLVIDQALIDLFTEVHVFKDLGKKNNGSKIAGTAIPSLGNNFLALDAKDADGSTLIHEIGHAKWSLRHPGSPCVIQNGVTSCGEFNLDDKFNFMHGINNVRVDRIRRYQFDAIHN